LCSPSAHVPDSHHVTGLFRDPGQARMAIAAARREGFYVVGPDPPLEDAEGVHVVLGTTGAAEDVRVLLLTCGAYSASMS
jgi:hypothetical protein